MTRKSMSNICHYKQSSITVPPKLTRDIKFDFEKSGYIILPTLISRERCDRLNFRLEQVLSGTFSTGKSPDKIPLIKEPKMGIYQQQNRKTLQIINIWKSDENFKEIVACPALGEFVAKLMNWKGARVAQDQVWIKPSNSNALVFHRDTPYFDFEPDEVLTVWIALDDMDDELGPLEYVKGSHLWSDERVGCASQFFSTKKSKSLLFDACSKAGYDPASLSFKTVGVRAGGAGVHNGRTWHGSGPNTSKNARRGIGIHFVPANSRFCSDLKKGMWFDLKEKYGGGLKLPDDEMPISWITNE